MIESLIGRTGYGEMRARIDHPLNLVFSCCTHGVVATEHVHVKGQSTIRPQDGKVDDSFHALGRFQYLLQRGHVHVHEFMAGLGGWRF